MNLFRQILNQLKSHPLFLSLFQPNESDGYEQKYGLWVPKGKDPGVYGDALRYFNTVGATYPRWKAITLPNPEKEEPEPRQVQGPLYGWRWWLLAEQPDGWRLGSTGHAHIWQGPTEIAHEKPALQTDVIRTTHYDYVPVGIHCYNDKQQAVKSFIETVPEDYQVTAVLGCVEVSGTVIKHQHGYRAEKATIQGLTMFEHDREVRTNFGWMRKTISPTARQIADLESTYQVDVVVERIISGDRPLDDDDNDEWDDNPIPELPCGPEEQMIEL